MKTTNLFHLALGLIALSCLGIQPPQVQAQESGYSESSEKYSREELAQMLAPIALYPDALLSQILMAATYPIEVIEADRWVQRNQDVQDEALDAALLEMNWDPSIKAICHFPSILALMSDRVTETTNLGNAFLAQENEVMDMVQKLRSDAYTQGNLTTTSQQKVIVEKETIIIEPADPRVIYVPYYDTRYIYGQWAYPTYHPYYWGPPGVILGPTLFYWPAFHFGFNFGAWSYFDWNSRYIYINVQNRPRYVRNNRWGVNPGRWNHVPLHRRGVAYRDKNTARKYGQAPSYSREVRRDTRRFPVQKNQDMDKSRNDRIIIDRTQQKRLQLERNKQEQAPIERDRSERDKPKREQSDRAQPKQQIQKNKQQRPDQEQQKKNPVERRKTVPAEEEVPEKTQEIFDK